MFKFLVIGAGGFVGAIARYSLSAWANRAVQGTFPIGTLLVNLLGCLAIGFLMMLVEERQALSANARLFLTIGLLGSLTTFSTFGYETLYLLRQNCLRLASYNIFSNLALGLIGVMLGGWLAHMLLRSAVA